MDPKSAISSAMFRDAMRGASGEESPEEIVTDMVWRALIHSGMTDENEKIDAKVAAEIAASRLRAELARVTAERDEAQKRLMHEEEAHEITLIQRNAAEQLARDVYRIVVGVHPPQWDGRFGFAEARAQIEKAFDAAISHAKTARRDGIEAASERAAVLFAKTQAEHSGKPQSEVNAIVRDAIVNIQAKDVTPSADESEDAANG